MAYNEIDYATYKNKLKHILLKSKQDYDACLLESYKSNMKNSMEYTKRRNYQQK